MSDAFRIKKIRILLKNHPDLFNQLFTPKSEAKSEMAADADTLWDRFGVCSSGEKVLLRAALDIWFDHWDRTQFLRVIDLLSLDENNRKAFARAYLELEVP